jgi:putative tributyrin esterase
MRTSQYLHAVVLVMALAAAVGCSRRDAPGPDAPRLSTGVLTEDVVFRSSALGRDMHYRVILPRTLEPGKKLPALYLLHGGGGDFREWSNYSDVAHYAETRLIIVMPQGDSSYYTNAASRAQDRYEDYIVNDLIADVESRFPAARERSHRAIAGVSMGGFGAVKLALKYPELFSFAGGISPALDVPTRPFSIKRIGQWRHHRSIFGDWQGSVQMQNDPYALAEQADPSKTPYLYVSCGDKEGLLPANRKFAAILSQRHFNYEFHVQRGGHNWTQWNAGVPQWVAVLLHEVEKDNPTVTSTRR